MNLSIRDMTRVALFASLICIASLVLKFGGEGAVPFSILPFMVMLSGAILGPRLGSLSVGVYVLIGLMGAPVFAKAPFGGLAYIFQPTFGFLPGFVLAAYVIGKLMGDSPVSSLGKYLVVMVVGTAVIYLVGIPYLYGIVKLYYGKPFSLWKAVEIGLLPFIGLDILKALGAGVIAKAVVPRLAGQGTPRYK